MKCVKCAREITTVQCPQCGYHHGKEAVCFLAEPNAKDIRIEFLDFEIMDGVLVKYKGKGLQVIVPPHVQKIGNGAFKGKKEIVKIQLPKGITEIQSNAFQNCAALEQINLPQSIEFYGSNLFGGCTNLKYVKVGGNKNTSFLHTFAGSSLERIDFQRGIQKINLDDLNWCTSLRTLKIPNSVTGIRMLSARQFGVVQVYASLTWQKQHGSVIRSSGHYHFADEPGTLRYFLHKPAVKRMMPLMIFAAVILTVVFAIAGVVNHINTNYIKGPTGSRVAIDEIGTHPSGIPVQKIGEAYYCREKTDGKYTYVKNAWREFDGKYYYFEEDGKMRTGGIWRMRGPSNSHETYGFHKETGEMLIGEVSRELLTDAPVGEPYEIDGERTFLFDENGVFVWEQTVSVLMEPENITLTWDDVSSQKSYANYKYYDDSEKRYWLPKYDLPHDSGYWYISCEASNITLTKGQLDKGWGLFLYCAPTFKEGWDWICLANTSYDPETGKVTAEAEIPEDYGYASGCMLVYGGIPWGAECNFDMTVTKLIRRETNDLDCSIDVQW